MNSSICKNIKTIQEKIKETAERIGRNPDEIQLMAVTKTKKKEVVLEAYQCGQHLFGENRVFEALEKYSDLPKDIELHLIGHLQRNKAKDAVAFVDWIDSVDKTSTLNVIEKECRKADKKMNILFEFNTSGEESKQGFRNEDDLWRTFDEVADCPHITVRGLMTIAPFTDDVNTIRTSFRRLRSIYEKSTRRYPETPLDTLSMGMSSDYEIAVEEGSTMVRLGSHIFGVRH